MATTYIQCYGVKDRFAPRSQIIRKAYGVNDNSSWVKLGGYWKDNGWNAVTENYFVVEKINGEPVEDADVAHRLEQIARQTIARKYAEDYSSNVVFFASNSSAGYEYPVLSPSQAAAIDSGVNIFDYTKFLRYAFAANYVYSIEPGVEPFEFSENPVFKKLMLKTGTDRLEVIDEFTGKSGLIAMAIKVPATQGLEEEILISYKGTNLNNRKDLVQDFELAIANLGEFDVDWQKDAYDFYQKIAQQYPPNQASFSEGYRASSASKTYNVVLTGHSLGAYMAIGVGVRTGVLARVFSSPATRIIGRYIHAFANTMRLNNVINVIRRLDPLATLSGNHDENMIYFPDTGSINVMENHGLSGIISDLLLPLSANAGLAKLLPPYVYITPDTTTGAGLKAQVNYWGEFNQ